MKRPGYRESQAPGFPVTWTNATSGRTAAYAGVGYSLSFGQGLSWSVNAELERDLSDQDPVLSAQADGIGTMAFESDFADTRGVLSTEVSYAFNNAVALSFSPYLGHDTTDKNDYGALLRLSGSF